jgi:hypothetical protein
MSPALPLPPLAAVLARPRRIALDAFVAAGWRPWPGPTALDAERRRLLNVDLSEPEVAFERDGELAGVAHVETDLEGLVVHVEVVGAEPGDPERLAQALLDQAGPARVGGGPEAREWVWGPESGSRASIGGEPVRLWMVAERAYGDRLWLVATLVRRG